MAMAECGRDEFKTLLMWQLHIEFANQEIYVEGAEEKAAHE